MRKDQEVVYQSIKRYIDALKQRNINVISSFLFGSYSRGNATEWSDIDLAIFTDRFIGDSFDFQFLLKKIAREIDADIEPHPFLVDDFNENNPMAVEILRTGVKVA